MTNLFADELDVCLAYFIRIVVANNVMVGLNFSANIATMGIVIPAIQVFDLATSELLRPSLEYRRSALVEANTTCLQLPEVVLEL